MIGKVVTLLVLFAVMLPELGAAEDHGGGKKLYQTYCTGCHGSSGKGDGPAGKTLPVKPADHTNGKKMSQYSDEHLVAVIAKGGASVGKSSQMPAWGAVLKAEQIQEIVGYIRTLASPEKDSAKFSGNAK